MKNKPVENEDDLAWRLRRLYPSKEYLFLKQVYSRSGSSSRIADALAIGLWSSRDVKVHGFEMKSSRGSWEQELRDPGKAEEIAQYCHRWWIVASDDQIVRQSELPEGWGLYGVVNGELMVLVPAKDRTPKPLSTDFMANLVRRAIAQQASTLTDEERDAQYKLGYSNGFEEASADIRKEHSNVIRALNEELHEALKSSRELERALGVRFEHLDGDSVIFLGNLIRMYGIVGKHGKVDSDGLQKLVNAHKFLSSDPLERVAGRLHSMRSVAKEIQNFIDEKLSLIPEVQRRINSPDMME